MRQRRWIELLQEYNFNIMCRPRKDNVVADGLSRKSFLNDISIPNNPILDKIKEASLNDPDYQDLIARIQNAGETKEFSRPAKEYFLQGDFLYYEQGLCIPKDPALKKAILFEAHDSSISRHPGYAKTLNAIRRSYFWRGMKGDILHYVKQCLSCQRIEGEWIKLLGQLKPLDIPQMKWEYISMDFVIGLPTIAGYDSIYVVVDMLTKVAHLMPVKTTYTASDISRVFIKEIFRLHGLSKRIVNDRDAKFTSKFWTSFFQAIGTQLCFNTAYHPQTDGQTQKVNQAIEDILRAYCSQEPRKWVQHLPLVEYAYNSFDHRSIGMSPFKAFYGQECIAPLNFSDPTIKVEAYKQMLDKLEAQTKAIRKDIQAAQDRQEHYADKDRSERTFKLGDKVEIFSAVFSCGRSCILFQVCIEALTSPHVLTWQTRYLIVKNVPALGCIEELVKLFGSYGPIEEYITQLSPLCNGVGETFYFVLCNNWYRLMDEEDSEPYTDIYWIKFVKISNARSKAKANMALEEADSTSKDHILNNPAKVNNEFNVETEIFDFFSKIARMDATSNNGPSEDCRASGSQVIDFDMGYSEGVYQADELQQDTNETISTIAERDNMFATDECINKAIIYTIAHKVTEIVDQEQDEPENADDKVLNEFLQCYDGCLRSMDADEEAQDDIDEFAKRKLDDFNFLGNLIQVNYAPTHETVTDTKEKLEERRSVLLSRIRSDHQGYLKRNQFQQIPMNLQMGQQLSTFPQMEIARQTTQMPHSDLGTM
ncbi:hypothetical protein L7F22_039514 [Adiantum nelumboides]|nr:hypothetical protein [Adiantum nelumboides]